MIQSKLLKRLKKICLIPGQRRADKIRYFSKKMSAFSGQPPPRGLGKRRGRWRNPLILRSLLSHSSFQKNFELGLLALFSIFLSAYKILMNDWNNYRIFYFSFEHLAAGVQLYTHYPDQYFDLFKYSPSFAALMSVFSFLPLWVGAILWNIFGVLFLWTGLYRCFQDPRPRGLLYFLLLPEWIGQVQNFQSNALLAGILLHGFADFMNKKWWRAGLLIGLSFHIKIFGAALGALGFLWGWRSFFRGGAWSLFFLIVVSLIPLFWVSPSQLIVLYKEWIELLQWDQSSSQGASFMGVFRSLAGFQLPNLPTQLLSFVLMMGAWILQLNKSREDTEANASRLQSFSMLLIWMIVFNHKSESPTFILGMVGFALWFLKTPSASAFPNRQKYELPKNKVTNSFTLNPPTQWRSPLLWVTFVFVSVLSSDLIPPNWKTHWILPLEMKVWPFIAVWFFLVFREYYDFFKSRGSSTAAV